MKSIIIFGKGPSVLKCTRKIVDDHDEIAICNYPPLNDFFYSLIKDKIIHYHFANCGTFDTRWTNELNHKLQIQKIFNTNRGVNKYMNYLNNNTLFQNKNLYQTIYKNYFDKNYKFKPPTGLYALHYILKTNKYNKITLIGFDGFDLNKTVYFFDIAKEGFRENERLLHLGVYSKDGKLKIPTEHPTDKVINYIKDQIVKYKNIKINIISNNDNLNKLNQNY